MNLKYAFRKRVCCIALLVLILIVVIRLSIHETPENWVTYEPRTSSSGRIDDSGVKTILLWTPFFGQADYIKPTSEIGCPELKCFITSNRTELDRAEAIVFHARDTNINDLPTKRFQRQRWVLLHHESPHHTPDIFKKLDEKINWTITYRLDSDIMLSPKVRKRLEPLKEPLGNLAASKTRMVVWFVSNCHTSSNREAYVKELQKTLHVDIIGSCGDKECMPKMSDKCYQDAAKEYRFYLSFENSICKDYITEKFFHVLSYDMVPVVLGGADYSKMAPPGSYLDALSFESPRALGKHLLDIAKDQNKYNQFFQWRNNYELSSEHYACSLCRKMHDASEPAKVWNRLHKWWFEEANCKNWNKGHHVTW